MRQIYLLIIFMCSVASNGYAQNLTLKSMNVKGRVSKIEYMIRNYDMKFGEVTEGEPRTYQTLVFNSKGTLVGEWYICYRKNEDRNNYSQRSIYDIPPTVCKNTNLSTPIDTIYRFYSYGTDSKPVAIRTYSQYGDLISTDEYVYKGGKLQEKNVYSGADKLYTKLKYEYYTNGQVRKVLYDGNGKSLWSKLYTVVNGDTIAERNETGITFTNHKKYANHKVVSEYVIASQKTNYVYDNLGNLKKQYEVRYNNFTKKYVNCFPVTHYRYVNDKAGNWTRFYVDQQNSEYDNPKTIHPTEERTLYGYDKSNEQIDEEANAFLAIENKLKARYSEMQERQAAEEARVEAEREKERKIEEKKKEQMDFILSVAKEHIIYHSIGYNYISVNDIGITGKIKKSTIDSNGITFMLKDKTVLPPINFASKICVNGIDSDFRNSCAYITEDEKIWLMEIQHVSCLSQKYLLVVKDAESSKIYEISLKPILNIRGYLNSL